MSIPVDLIDTLNDVCREQPITKEDKNFIKDNLIFLQQFADDDELEIINPLIESFEKKCLTNNDKRILIQNKQPIIQIINRYEEEFNNFEELIDNKLRPSQVERDLDKKIKKYDFDEYHPMLGISYNKPKKTWRIQLDYTDTASINKEKIIERSKKYILSQYYDYAYIDKIVKKYFVYKCNYIMVYYHNGEALFDIMHIILTLGLGENQGNKIYNTNSKYIVHFFLHQNKFGGYIARELINIDTVKKIIGESRQLGSLILAKMIGINVFDTKIISKEISSIEKIVSVFKKEKFIEQYIVCQYRVDLYFHDYKLAIECDELGHRDRDSAYEKERQKFIEKNLCCTFIRFNPDDPHFDIFDVISKIFYHIKK